MKTFTTIRFRPKPQHFDDVVESLAKRVDFWAERTSTEKVYLVQDEDEVIFTAILAQMEILLEYQDEALNFLDSLRPNLQKYSDSIKYGLILFETYHVVNDLQLLNILGTSYSIINDYRNGNYFFHKYFLHWHFCLKI